MKKNLEVYCHYARQFIPLGRSKTKCPRCGCALGMAGHETREAAGEGKP